MHHRRRGLTRVAAVVTALLLTVAAGGCSGDDDPGQGSGAAEGTRPTGSIVPGGSTPSSVPGTTPSSSGTTGPNGSDGGTTTGSGDPSEGIPQDQFCRGFREVHSAESAMSKAREDDDLTAFQNAFSRIVVAWQAMAENPPDEVYDEMRAVFFMYDELAAQVADAQTIDDLTEIALALQTDDRAEDLEVVRDHGAGELLTRHYLDHASTSPLRPAARDAMVRWLDHPTGDPGQIHAEGMTARVAVEEAREAVAELLGARSREVVFTSGATESIATACLGVGDRGAQQVVPAIEHSAVRESAARAGAVATIGVDEIGRVDPGALLDAIAPDTALVHLQWGNHEVGTVQPVAEVVAACRDRGVLVHVDAAQAVGRVPIDFRALGADLLSVSGHKLGGPPGTGALLVRRGLRLEPLLRGGDQERARRAGMENVAAIAGFGAAATELSSPGRLEQEATEQRRLTDRVLAAVKDLDGVVVYGGTGAGRLPHLVCLGVAGIEPQAVLLGLDRAGIAAHSGSACSTESLEPSPVLEAMGVDAHRSLRVSVGWDTSDEDIDALLRALPGVIADLRALGGERR